MSKKKIIILLPLALLIAFLVTFLVMWRSIKVESISYHIDDKLVYAYINFKKMYLDGECVYNDKRVSIIDGTCVLEIPNESVYVTVETKVNSISVLLNPNQNEIIDFNLLEDKFYLLKDEEKEINISFETLGLPQLNYSIVSEDENIARVVDNKIIGVGNGKTIINVMASNITKTIEVIVTDLITEPILNKNKSSLPCGKYSLSDNKLLDEFLAYEVEKSGYKTRGGVVTALRFLTLQFPYKIDYFFENGRLNNNTGGRYIDGEGRYYHKGLYLDSYKFQELKKVGWGPSTWGCPLTNWEDDGKYKPFVKYPNGLDCSGFITWVLYNGGFDPSDTGAGDTSYVDDDLGDIGPHVPLTSDLLSSGKLKAGDIIASDGHVAMIGGITDSHIYVGESTTYWDGVVMHEYTYDELLRMPFLTYVILMDDYYKEEGTYTDYWE